MGGPTAPADHADAGRHRKTQDIKPKTKNQKPKTKNKKPKTENRKPKT
jgi:hypothetical protein